MIIPAVGGVIFCVMVIPDDAVQPLDAVTVTVYVPAAVKLLFAVEGVVPPVHR